MKKRLAITAIIPAAGKPNNVILHDSNLPDTMLPINGKPVIGYILEDLLGRGIPRVIILISEHDKRTEEYTTLKFSSKLEIKILRMKDKKKGLGNDITACSDYIQKNDSILIYLGDTIYKSKLSFDRNFLIVSKKIDNPSKWCMVEKKGDKLIFIDKPKEYKTGGEALCGIYFFKNYEKLKKAFDSYKKESGVLQMSNILHKYFADEKCKLVAANKWYDCGNIENYQKARIDFLKIRNFNSIEHNSLFGLITKKSKNHEKIKHEIYWYENLPKELKIFSPRLIDYKLSKDISSYSIEFYGYHSLSDLFVFGSLDIGIWKLIIDHIFDVLKKFKSYKTKIPLDSFNKIYITKTLERIDSFKNIPYWNKLLKQEKIIINGTSYKNISQFLKKIPDLTRELSNSDDMCVIHGDLCLSNILFDTNNKIIKLIDPRGSFGDISIYGDHKYDLAKQRHSFSGLYDFIISDLFEITSNKAFDYDFNIYSEKKHEDIKDYFDNKLTKHGYDIKHIKFIEALLFLSMIPLHKEDKKRQLAMYLTAVRLIEPFV